MTRTPLFLLCIGIFTINAALDMPNLVHLFLAVVNLAAMLMLTTDNGVPKPKK